MIIFIVLAVVAIVIMIKATNKKQREEELEWEKREVAARIQNEKNKQKKEREEALLKQKQLEEKYAASVLTKEIIRTISDGTGRKPEEIEVYNDHVSGRTNGAIRTFDFASNRVENLKNAVEVITGDRIDEEKLLRPQLALASAINRILGGEYSITDMAKRSAKKIDYSDGDYSTQYGYFADRVIMRLKPTNNF